MPLLNKVPKTPQELLAERLEFVKDTEMARSAALLHARLVEAVKKVPVEALAALARQVSPSTSGAESLNTFANKFLEELQSLQEYAQQGDRLLAIERHRLKPAFAKAAHRLFTIIDEQKNLESFISNFERTQANKKKHLAEAGLTVEEIKQLTQSESGLTELLEKREQLAQEYARLERFTRHQEEQYLPPDLAEGILSFEEAYAQAHAPAP